MMTPPLDPESMSHTELLRQAKLWHDEVRPILIAEEIQRGGLRSLIEYHEHGGPANISFFEDISGDFESLRGAIECHLRTLPEYDLGPVFRPWVKSDALLGITPTRISALEFYGAHFDPEAQRLNLDAEWPDASPGQSRGAFAFAFSQPPHGVDLSEKRLLEIFLELDRLISPTTPGAEILDWSSPKLGDVSNYFEAGLEWWGVFLLTVYLPSVRRLTVITASSTD